MGFSFNFFSDPALTTPLPTPFVFVQTNSAPVPDDRVIWFGSPLATVTCQAVSNPGVTPIQVSLVDAAPGLGSPPGDIKLALSSAGLTAAVGGAALSLPATVAGGSANAIAIHIRVTDSTHVIGQKTDLSLTTNALVQS